METLPHTLPAAFDLRGYQLDALAAIQHAESRGVRRQLLALPCGTGKTVAFAELIRRRPGRALVLAHRDELVAQAVDKLAMTGLEHVGVVKAERNGLDAPVIVASVQTVSQPHRLAALAADFSTVVIDEAHHATAESYRRVLEHVGGFREDGPLVLGVTATAERADGTPLGEVFEEIVFESSLVTMIHAGYLSDLRAVQVHVKADFTQLHTRAGDFIESESEALLLAANAPADVARAYQQHAAGRKALLFTPTVATAYAMRDAFVEAGIVAEAIDGATPMDLRRAVLGRFHRGETRVVSNCAVLSEGYDEASIDCIVMARPTKSRPLYVQMVGRGTRRFPGKPDCLVLDVVGATARHDLVTAATLFGVPPVGVVEDSVVEAVAARQLAETQEAQRGQLVARAVDLFRARPLSWVTVSPVRFALAIGEGGTLVLAATPDGRWAVRQLTRDRQEVTLQAGLDLGYAQGWAEDHARRLGASILIAREAPWRRELASAKQLDTCRRCRIPVPPGATKGAVADLLTRAFARSRR